MAGRFPPLRLSIQLMLMADKNGENNMLCCLACCWGVGAGGGVSGSGPAGRGVTFSQLRLLFTSNCQAAISEGDARCHPPPIFLRGIYQLRPQKH